MGIKQAFVTYNIERIELLVQVGDSPDPQEWEPATIIGSISVFKGCSGHEIDITTASNKLERLKIGRASLMTNNGTFIPAGSLKAYRVKQDYHATHTYLKTTHSRGIFGKTIYYNKVKADTKGNVSFCDQ